MFTDKCGRPNCNHEAGDHPNDGHCLKCNCVGFFRNLQVTNPLQEKYIQKVIDLKTQFDSILDMADHLNEDFPKISKDFFYEKKKIDDEYLNQLNKENFELWNEVNNILSNFNQLGRRALRGASRDALGIIGKLMHHGANYQLSLGFTQEMILSYTIIMFRTFVKDICIIMYERDEKSKTLWKTLDNEEKEERARLLAENHIRDMATELRKNFGFDLKNENDFNDFVEPFYRRDMYTHNEGFPNQKYRDRVSYTGPDVKLVIDNNYLEKTIKLLRKYVELIEEYCLEHYMYVVNVNKKGNVHHVDLTKDGGKIIPIKDDDESK